MILQWYKLLGRDRQVEHPAFGVISCNAIQDSHRKCIELMNTNALLDIQCKTLYELSFQCYKAKSDEDFKRWIDREIEEKKRLKKYMRDNGSIMPDLQKKNVVQDLYANAVDEIMYLEESGGNQNEGLDEKESFKENIKFFETSDDD